MTLIFRLIEVLYDFTHTYCTIPYVIYVFFPDATSALLRAALHLKNLDVARRWRTLKTSNFVYVFVNAML